MAFDWDVYKGNLGWLRERTIFACRAGSHAYGTNIATSDIDYRGVCIAPRSFYLGLSLGVKGEEESIAKKGVVVQSAPNPDLTVFELRKFLRLAADVNPNVIELLFVDPSDHLIMSPAWEQIIEIRDSFLSKRAKHRFSGYALSQLKRINTHYRWLKDPPLGPPTRAEFQLPERTLIPADQLAAARSQIQKRLDESSWHELDDLDESTRQAIKDEFTDKIAEIMLWSDEDMENKPWRAVAQSLGYSTNFIEYLDMERRYNSKQKDWESYLRWKKERNPQRAELEAKYGYDCYAADTEFLTSNGWKSFDEITISDRLATVFVRRGADPDAAMAHRSFLGVEYQVPIDRFDAVYNGPMYHVTGQHTDSLVTPNHRMLFQKVERKSGIRSSEWLLEEASVLPDTFDVLVSPIPKTSTYSNQDIFRGIPVPPRAYLTLMGWYLSDGCAVFDTDGDMSVKSVRCSQKPGGKLSWHMARWHGAHGEAANSSLYQYARDPNSYNPEPHEERVLDVRHPEIAGRIVTECGFKETKRIPRYAFDLSRNLMEHLLLGLLRGDGTKREHKTKEGSFIYYSKSRALAGDVQQLAMMSGWETAMWGPYPSEDVDGRVVEMHQVHLRRDVRTRRFIRSQNVKKIEVSGQRIVCFTVPNGTLITRRNGKVAIHGNSKHALHLVRLLRMCREILTEGVVRVRRPDAEDLLAIRNGAWTYERLVEWAVAEDRALTELARISKLPNLPDRQKIEAVCQKLVWESFLQAA